MDELNRHTDLCSSDKDQEPADALAEFLDRQARGESPSVQDLIGKHPQWQAALEEAILGSQAIDEALADEETSPIPSGLEAAPPVSVPGYQMLRKLGSGGMGQVWLAKDERLDRLVAIKFLNPSWIAYPEVRTRFTVEARALARLNHPGIVAIFQSSEEAGQPFFIMEYVSGLPLTDALQRLPFDQKINHFYRVIQAVAFLHRQGMVHRDLKPANILVDTQGKTKILDLGLVRSTAAGTSRLTQPGGVVGTIDYLSPEQAKGEAVDPRSDVFSLGVTLYEVLTGLLPFAATTYREQIEALEKTDPVWPRHYRPELPRGIQDICLKAMEKNPSDRYSSAQEMADDLARFQAGETVLAQPTVYLAHLSGKIEKHVGELRVWQQEQLLSPAEFDSFRRLYERLIEREDAWIMEMRRLSLSQVALYLGGWLMTLGAILLVFFNFEQLPAHVAVATVIIATGSSFAMGMQEWRQNLRRTGIAFLLTFTLLFLVGTLVVMNEYGWGTLWTQGSKELEFFPTYFDFSRPTNTQMWWALLLILPVCLGLRRYSGATVFSLEMAFMALLLAGASLLRMGLLDWIRDDPGKPFLYLLPVATGYFLIGYFLEIRGWCGDSRYLHGHGVFLTYLALSGIAGLHDPLAQWLQGVFPGSRGQVEYLFIFNALIYWTLQFLCDRLPSAQLHQVGKFFRFVIAGHILMPLWILGLKASERWEANPLQGELLLEVRILELLLPLIAAIFVFYSIPRQMKNYLAAGMVFLAIGVIRLEKDWFQGYATWPLALMINGLVLMLAVRYSTRLKLILQRFLHPRR